MADKKHIINHPGGVILHLADGSAEHFGYGQEVDPERLADYQREHLDRFTDDKDRSAYLRESAVEQAAHRGAAHADAGQINSTSDPVPGNYGELSEEDAAQLVLSVTDPQVQARLLLHERVNHGSRQMVIDAGSPVARAIAETLYRNHEEGLTRYDQTPSLDRERNLERESRGRGSKSGGSKSGKSGDGASTPAPNS